jgi:integrase
MRYQSRPHRPDQPSDRAPDIPENRTRRTAAQAWITGRGQAVRRLTLLKVRGKGAKERIVPVGSTARAAIVRYMGQRGVGGTDDALFLGRRGPLDARGIQQLVRRLKTRVGVAGRLSPHSLRHSFARSYLVDGGDVFSLLECADCHQVTERTSPILRRCAECRRAIKSARSREASQASPCMCLIGAGLW